MCSWRQAWVSEREWARHDWFDRDWLLIHFGTSKPLLPYLYARVLVIEDFVFLENSAAAIIKVHSNLKATKKPRDIYSDRQKFYVILQIDLYVIHSMC